MTVRVLFFGATADLVGGREFEIPIVDHDSASDVLGKLEVSYPGLRDRKILLAINEEYVRPETVLKDGDELAVFTAVSGG